MEQAKVEAIMKFYLKQNGLMIKTRMGKEIICRRPDFSRRVLTAAQKEAQRRFSQAGVFAAKAMADPRVRASYEKKAKVKKRTLRSFIMSDFIKPPSVDEIDLSRYLRQAGNTIAIRADDDFKVVGVYVAISAASQLVEYGEAVRSATDPRWWLYTATTTVPPGTDARVAATARDRPGNRTTRTEFI